MRIEKQAAILHLSLTFMPIISRKYNSIKHYYIKMFSV